MNDSKMPVLRVLERARLFDACAQVIERQASVSSTVLCILLQETEQTSLYFDDSSRAVPCWDGKTLSMRYTDVAGQTFSEIIGQNPGDATAHAAPRFTAAQASVWLPPVQARAGSPAQRFSSLLRGPLDCPAARTRSRLRCLGAMPRATGWQAVPALVPLAQPRSGTPIRPARIDPGLHGPRHGAPS